MRSVNCLAVSKPLGSTTARAAGKKQGQNAHVFARRFDDMNVDVIMSRFGVEMITVSDV
jgi:hypothetical protein